MGYINLVPSRAKLKNLGSIVEYLMKNIDLNRFYVVAGAEHNQIRIQVWPKIADGIGPYFDLPWMYGFNSKLVINADLLRNGSEW
jgi:hypothetical protein